jgi:membrane protease YdiL (CAAX protease family)
MLSALGQSRDLVKAWGLLVILGFATTALAAIGGTGFLRHIIAFSVLILAGAKARLILNEYLGLRKTRFWRRTFELSIGLFLTLALVLYLAARTSQLHGTG